LSSLRAAMIFSTTPLLHILDLGFFVSILYIVIARYTFGAMSLVPITCSYWCLSCHRLFYVQEFSTPHVFSYKYDL